MSRALNNPIFKGLSYRSNTATIYRLTVNGWALISTCFLKYGVIHAFSRKLRHQRWIQNPEQINYQ